MTNLTYSIGDDSNENVMSKIGDPPVYFLLLTHPFGIELCEKFIEQELLGGRGPQQVPLLLLLLLLPLCATASGGGGDTCTSSLNKVRTSNTCGSWPFGRGREGYFELDEKLLRFQKINNSDNGRVLFLIICFLSETGKLGIVSSHSSHSVPQPHHVVLQTLWGSGLPWWTTCPSAVMG